MKKSILQFSFLAAIAATMTLFTSCSKEESVGETFVPTPVQFNIGVGDLSVSRAATRTQASDTETDWNESIDGKFDTNDKIFIYTADADGKYYKKQYNVDTPAASAAGNNAVSPSDNTATGKFYWRSSTERKQYEIYSYGKNATETPTTAGSGDASMNLTIPEYTVTNDQTNVATPEEFLYGYGTIYYSTAAKTLKLAHQLARIDIVITTPKNTVAVDKNGDSDTTDDGEAAQTANDMSVTIGTATTPRSGNFSKPSFTPTTAEADAATVAASNTPADQIEEGIGSWTTTATAQGAYTPRVLQKQTYNSTPGNFTTKYSAVVMPWNFPQDVAMFTIVYDGATYAYKPASAEEIAAGYHYTYTVTIQENVLNVTNVTILNWTTSDKNATAVLQ